MDECKKLEKHLSLLRDEYSKLQTKLVEYERKYENLAATLGSDSDNLEQADHLVENSFVNRLLKKVADLFEKDLYRLGLHNSCLFRIVAFID
uniref:Uncharacterized protein n=1 Tax=Romanomermis culicivorax TaxID=13658 RepID=A0A915JK32_ROMCU